MLGPRHPRFWRIVAAGVVLSALGIPVALNSAVEPSIEDLKGRVANAKISDRPPLCLQICERQLGAAGRFYVAGDSEPAKAALADVVAFAELTRDYSIQSRKHEKQSEIAIRRMIHKLADLKHTVSHEDQEQIQNTIDRLQRIRDDLLAAMFPKVGKK
jgi:hypothetical protein